MENLTVMTMPIKPYEKINIGLMIAPTLVDIIGSTLKCKKVLSFNLLHSFDNKIPVLEKYIDNIHNFNINYDEIIKDVEWVEKYLTKIEELYIKEAIVLKKGNILKCDCGRVEMAFECLKNGRDGDLYYWNKDKIICKFCGKECKQYSQKNLYLEIKKEFCKDISISPSFSKKEIKNLADYFINRSILISKNRKTDYFINIEGHIVNIDIDMLWTMFNQIEENENQILIASNHQLYEMFISNYINNILGNKKLHYIATPYLTNKENIDFQEKIFSLENSLYKKMAILYNLKWKYQTTNWNNGILEMLNKLSDEELKELYSIILSLPVDSNSSIENFLNDLLNGVNLSKNIKMLRR